MTMMVKVAAEMVGIVVVAAAALTAVCPVIIRQ